VFKTKNNHQREKEAAERKKEKACGFEVHSMPFQRLEGCVEKNQNPNKQTVLTPNQIYSRI